MTNILAFANQKGGVGKTTSCINLATSVVMSNYRVLVLDLDPQGNATMGSGVDKNSLDVTMNELLMGEVTAAEAILRNTPAGYDLISANADLTAAEVALLKKNNQQQCLAKALLPIMPNYDFIFLDCPPSLNMLTLNALVAADSVMIAMQCEYYALEGLSDLLRTIEQLKTRCNPKLSVFGIIRTMYDGRNRLCLEVSKQLLQHFGNKVFQTVIPRNVRLAEAPSYGLPIQLYEKNSLGAASYLALANEFLKRFSKQG
ncbi:MAG TPA: ParA family protein, partial [Gammaproteobacteria bacterium]|nr:ParA family protein [Gammaproteobacteria bacterium]